MYPIASTTVGAGGASSITFSSIPQNFTHLQLRAFTKNLGTSSNYVAIRVNGDSTNGDYTQHYLGGNGSSAYSGASVPDSVWAWQSADNNSAANIFGVCVLDILDYTNTNKYKTMKNLNGFDANGSGQTQLNSGLWLSTSALNSILIYTFGPNFAQYSTFQLYGISTSNVTGA
jgi:hypothetical protein